MITITGVASKARAKLRACFPALPPGPSNDLIEQAVDEILLDAQREASLAGPTEAAVLLGVSRQRVHQLSFREEFPAPVAELSMGPVWLIADLLLYDQQRNKKSGRPRRE